MLYRSSSVSPESHSGSSSVYIVYWVGCHPTIDSLPFRSLCSLCGMVCREFRLLKSNTIRYFSQKNPQIFAYIIFFMYLCTRKHNVFSMDSKFLRSWIIALLCIGIICYIFSLCKIFMQLQTTIIEIVLLTVLNVCVLIIGLSLSKNQKNAKARWGGWMFILLGCLGLAKNLILLIEQISNIQVRSLPMSVGISTMCSTIVVLAYILIALSYKHRGMLIWGILRAIFSALFILGGWKAVLNGPENTNFFLYCIVIPLGITICQTVYYIKWLKHISD